MLQYLAQTKIKNILPDMQYWYGFNNNTERTIYFVRPVIEFNGGCSRARKNFNRLLLFFLVQ